MMSTTGTLHRLLLIAALAAGLAPRTSRAATSIFDDESWEDPKIESTAQPSKPAPPPVDVAPPAPREPTPPTDTAPPAPPQPKPKPKPTPIQPVEPAKPTLPLPAELEPHELIKQA